MVKLVASRVAAIRLVWIIAVLMIPILILGFFLVRSIQDEMDFNRHEQLGIQFLQVLSPVMIDAAEGKSKSQNYEFLREHGADIALAVDERGEFERLRKALNASPIDPVLIFKLTNELILQTGEISKIILDPIAETYYLGAATSQGMPDLMSRYKQLQYTSESALKSFDDKSLSLVASANGELREATRLLWSQVNSAKTAGRSNYEYLPILVDFDLINKVNTKRTQDILTGFGTSHDASMSMLHEITTMSDSYMNMNRSLWSKINARFSVQKNQQSEALNKKLSIVIVASLVSVLIGLGSAITMFQSTLKRLDDISQAKLDAELAQKEAEELAGKLTLINDDIVVVNKELAYQMQMLKEAQDALVSKGRMEQLGQLTATIAHELRNPLGAVRTSAFLIERKIKGKELGFETQLARINNGVSRCDDIITQLLDFSRTKPLHSRPSDLDHWLVKMIEDEAKQLPAAVAIECDLNLHGKDVPFDPARLQRAIINLLSNASEAMVGKGDDPSRFETSTPVICVTTQILDGHAVIRIKDNGPGISPENLEKILEPLFTTKSFGTGLGLPAVEQIARQHNGRLEVNSILGQGAEFVIHLPMQSAQEKAA
jgi:signal transduction histidine kinase